MLLFLAESGVDPRGLIFQFFVSLYRLLEMATKVGMDETEFKIQLRGLRQGCSASPGLFLIFVNSIFDKAKAEGLGIDFPKLDASDISSGFVDKLIGLLFADDAVLIADSCRDARRLVKCVEEWAKVMGMVFNASKSAVMVVCPAGVVAPVGPSFRISIGGVPVKRVKVYTYLGVAFNDALCLEDMVKARAKQCLEWDGVVWKMRNFIGNKWVSLNIRRQTVLGLLLPSLAYGGELFGMRSCAAKATLLKPLEDILDGVLFQMSRASTSTTCKRPSLTTAKILREEYGIPSVSAVMAGKAVRASLKYRSSKGWVQQLYVTDPPAASASWRAKVEKSCSALLKKFGVTSVTSTMGEWVESGAFQSSWAQKSLGRWGRFSRKTFLAAAAGPVDFSVAETADAASKVGKRIQILFDEWLFRSEPEKAKGNAKINVYANRYGNNGFRHSSEALVKIAGLHPEFASGFHWLARCRSGNFIKWSEALKMSDRSEGRIKLARTDLEHGCPCCNKHDVPDSLEHFLLECKNPELVRIRMKLNLVSASEVLSKAVDEGYRKRPTNSARTSSRSPSLTAGSQCNLLLGGDQIVYVTTRRGTQIAPKDSATSAGSSARYSLLLLRRFPLGNEEHVAIRGVVDGILDGSKRRSKSIQKNQKLLEASLLVVAKFLQKAMPIRNAAFWQSCSPSPPSLSQSVIPVGQS